MFLDGKELRPIDGDFAEFKRNSVGGGVVDGEQLPLLLPLSSSSSTSMEADDGSDGLACEWPPYCGDSRWLRSDNRSKRMTPS